MKSKYFLLFVAAVCGLFNPLNAVFAQGTAFTYQGRLNTNGTPANGAFDLRFTLYDANAVGNVIAGPLDLPAVAVANGLFTAQLDFGEGVFSGAARWLEIAVSPAGANSFISLSPRQAVSPTPYAIYAGSAGSVPDGTVVANQLNTGGVAPTPGQFLSYDGGNLVWNDPEVVAGNIWSLSGNNAYYTAGNVGIGTSTPAADIRLEVLGTTHLKPGNGAIQFGSPNGELGMSLIPTTGNRADLRFDGSTLKLIATAGVAPPFAANGLAITTEGNVGIGIVSPAAGYRLEVAGATLLRPGNGMLQFGSPNSELGLTISPNVGNRADLRFDGSVLKLAATVGQAPPSAANGIAITTAGNVGVGTTTPIAKLQAETPAAGNVAVYGIASGTSSVGVYGSATAASSAGVWGHNPTGSAVHADGNATQKRDNGGFVKAMAYIDPFLPANQYVVRCYNSQQAGTAASTAPCGITVTRFQAGEYRIDFGFNVEDRFVSLTPQANFGAVGLTVVGMITSVSGSKVDVLFQRLEDGFAETRFHIIVLLITGND